MEKSINELEVCVAVENGRADYPWEFLHSDGSVAKENEDVPFMPRETAEKVVEKFNKSCGSNLAKIFYEIP
jgi:hypothetical protein